MSETILKELLMAILKIMALIKTNETNENK